MSFDPTMLAPSLYRLYEEDRALMSELGLEPHVQFKHGEWKTLGTYEHRPSELVWARVTIECCAMPAHFWRFSIEQADVEDVQSMTLKTGSGSLTEYWPTVLHVANGCLHIEE